MTPQFLAMAVQGPDRGPGKLREIRRVQIGHLPVDVDLRPTAVAQNLDLYEHSLGIKFVIPEGHTSANEGEKPPRIPSTNPFKKK